MIPLVDFHCHLLAGLDDGPRTQEEAVAMCRRACEQGTSLAAATAHQNEHFAAVTPARIRQACQKLAQALLREGVPLTVLPSAEVRVHPDLEISWRSGRLLSVADRGEYLLLELPEGVFIDLTDIVLRLRAGGIRPIVAHAERYPELLYEQGRIEHLIGLGCLIQVSASGVTDPISRKSERALRRWFRQGQVHLLGSDAHSVVERPPELAGAYHRIARWAGSRVADRVCSTHGMAILQGLPLRLPAPEVPRRRWLAFW